MFRQFEEVRKQHTCRELYFYEGNTKFSGLAVVLCNCGSCPVLFCIQVHDLVFFQCPACLWRLLEITTVSTQTRKHQGKKHFKQSAEWEYVYFLCLPAILYISLALLYNTNPVSFEFSVFFPSYSWMFLLLRSNSLASGSLFFFLSSPRVRNRRSVVVG